MDFIKENLGTIIVSLILIIVVIIIIKNMINKKKKAFLLVVEAIVHIVMSHVTINRIKAGSSCFYFLAILLVKDFNNRYNLTMGFYNKPLVLLSM